MSNIPKCCVFVFHIFCFNNIFLHFVLKTSIIFCNICYKVRLSRPLILAPSFISWKFRTYHQCQVIAHNEGMVLVTFIDNGCHISPFFNLFSPCTVRLSTCSSDSWNCNKYHLVFRVTFCCTHFLERCWWKKERWMEWVVTKIFLIHKNVHK